MPMPKPIHAIYENGVFKPLVALNLPEHQPVLLILKPAKSKPGQDEQAPLLNNASNDPWEGIRTSTGIPDLAENFEPHINFSD